MPEPTSEDDYPDDEVLSTPPFQDGTKIRTINYIREEGEDFFKPLNVQIDDAESHNAKASGSEDSPEDGPEDGSGG
jgi:hypothetical protein